MAPHGNLFAFITKQPYYKDFYLILLKIKIDLLLLSWAGYTFFILCVIPMGFFLQLLIWNCQIIAKSFEEGATFVHCLKRNLKGRIEGPFLSKTIYPLTQAPSRETNIQ